MEGLQIDSGERDRLGRSLMALLHAKAMYGAMGDHLKALIFGSFCILAVSFDYCKFRCKGYKRTQVREIGGVGL